MIELKIYSLCPKNASNILGFRDLLSHTTFTMHNYNRGFVTPYFFFLFSFATRAGSPQQREPVTVGPYYLTHPVNFPCGRKPEYPDKTHDFRQSVAYTKPFGRALTILFSHEDWVRVNIKMTLLGIELGTLEVKREWSDHYTTEAP